MKTVYFDHLKCNMLTYAPLRTLLAAVTVVLFFSPKNAHSGIVLNAFTGIKTELTAYEYSDLNATRNGEGLLDSSSQPTTIHDTDYSHDYTDIYNSWIFQVDEQAAATPFDVYLKLEGLYMSSGLTGLDGFYLWNQNAGDSVSAGPGYEGNSGVKNAMLYYTTDVSLDFNDIDSLKQASWTPLWTGSFAKQTGNSSSAQSATDLPPVFASYLKFSLINAWGSFPNSVDRIGFAELAYHEYIPPAPPVVPEPGSVAVFGGLMAVGGLMRWRRRRSVGG